jgi:nucleotide-binding universal stress UspA family protein
MGYRRVLVGTDGSATASEAVRHAAALASSFDAELLIVTAFQPQPPPALRLEEEPPEELQWTITDSAVAEEHASVARRIARDAGVEKVRVRAERGEPADALVRVADEAGVDVIVVGSKGMASASRFLLGSVPNKVSHHAPCDVLIVHTVN